MRVVNTKHKEFAGSVVIYGEKVYVNTKTGVGFDKIFNLMRGFIQHFSFKYGNCLGGVDDARQEVCLSIFEGILKYDNSRGASLSTFLNIFVPNKMLDKARKVGARNKPQHSNIKDEDILYFTNDPLPRLELEKRVEQWNERWKDIMFRLFVSGEKVSDVAFDEGLTPWGLTRAVRRKLIEARKL